MKTNILHMHQLMTGSFTLVASNQQKKWTKDKKERILEFGDILHYQKIIFALTETDVLIKGIDKIELGI
jgi:hypothetical protein